jgi:hypothetical protein
MNYLWFHEAAFTPRTALYLPLPQPRLFHCDHTGYAGVSQVQGQSQTPAAILTRLRPGRNPLFADLGEFELE